MADRLRLKQVVDRSSVTVPPSGGVGDLPTVFGQMFDKTNTKHTTNISAREAALCSLLSAMSLTDGEDLNQFVDDFLTEFYALKSSVKGWKGRQMANICSGNVDYEKKLEFARIKSRQKEDFV